MVRRSCAVIIGLCSLASVLDAGALRAQDAQDAPPQTSATAATPAEATPTETSPERGAESARRAREEFRLGVEHYQAGRYVEAIHSFQVAASLIPSADLWFNIASAYEQLSRSRAELSDYEQAIGHYRRYLTERVDPPDRAAVEGSIAVLTERLEAARAAQTIATTQGTLRLHSEFEGATVRVDDEVVGQTPLDRDLPLAPGRHRVEATREHYLPYLAEVGVELGVTTTTRIHLEPAQSHRALVQSPVFAWVAWGLAGAALAGAVGVGVHAASLAPAQFNPGMFEPGHDPYAESRTWGAISDGLLAASVGLTTVGIALFFFEGRAVGTVTERGGVPVDVESTDD